MQKELSELIAIFSRTKTNVQNFMGILSPIIVNAQDEHQRMYFHHIFEEEEQHMERLEQFVPNLSKLKKSYEVSEAPERALISLLQDINLEKFGQHNFLEHLELALFHFQTGEQNERLQGMIRQTNDDYLIIKDILFQMNEQFLPEANRSKESDHHEVLSAAHQHQTVHHNHSTSQVPPQNLKKKLTVGSLKA